MFFLAQSATTTTSIPTTTSSLSPVSGWVVVVIMAAVIILAGLVVILGRSVLDPQSRRSRDAKRNKVHTLVSAGGTNNHSSNDSASLIRSWIAISLVSGLLICCAVAFSLSDDTLGGTLFGGLITSTGSALAYYFSTKTAEQARQDVITASQSPSQVVVPSLVSMTLAAAQIEMSKTPLQMINASPATGPLSGPNVATQTPTAGSVVPSGTQVTITTGQ